MKLKFIILILYLLYANQLLFCQLTNPKTLADSFNIIRERFLDLATNSQFDSALYFGRQLDKLAVSGYGSNSEQDAGVLYYMGEIYRLQENYHEAYNCFKRSINIFDGLDSVRIIPGLYALATARIAFMCDKLGSLNEEREYLKKAITTNNKLNHRENLQDNAQLYLLLANVYMYKGEYKQADSVYAFVKSVLDTLPRNAFNLYLQASVYANKAILYNETGNNIKSIEYTRKALPLEAEAKDSGYTDDDDVVVCLNLAAAYAANENMDSAWKICKQAEESLKGKHDNYLTAQIIKQKAYLYQQENNYEKSIELTKKFISVADTLPEIIDDYNSTLVNLGVLYTSIQQYASADSLFKKIISRLQDSGLIYSYSFIQAKKGLCLNLIQEKKYAEATDSLLALIHFDFEAMNKNFAGMSEAEKLNYQSEADKVFDLLYICLNNNQSTPQKTLNNIYKAELERKGLILRNKLNELSIIRNSKNTELINFYNEWQTNSEILAKQNSLPFNQRIFKVDSLEEANNYFEKQVTELSSLPVNGNENTLPASVAPTAGAADIDFVRYNYKSLSSSKDSGFYAAFITTGSDGLPHFIYLCSEQQLINLMKDENGKWINENQLTQDIYSKQDKKSRALYNLIWQKLDQRLTGIKTINYSTAGLLNNIAFPAIYNGKNFLIDDYSFNRYFSLQQSYTATANNKMPQQINIWGNINYNYADYNNDDSAQNITAHHTKPSTETNEVAIGSSVKDISNEPLQSFNTNEVDNLKKAFDGKNITINSTQNTKATEDKFKQTSSSFSGILHISTHGFYTPFNQSYIKSSSPSSYISATSNPLFRCGLAFAGVNYYWLKGKLNNNHDDGILTGYEISQLDLHNVQLVTLSACETGLGDITNNEGDIGLQRAFKIAGVQTLLVSLWQVPAKQTSQLLALFYKYWMQGESLDKALRLANLTMEKQYPPYFWAGFVLIK